MNDQPPLETADKATGRRRPFRSMLLIRGLAVAIAAFIWLWALLALWFYDPWPSWLRIAACAVWLTAAGCLIALRNRSCAAAMVIGLIAIVVMWSFHRPSNDRDWADDQQQLPVAVFDGNTVTIRNVRHATYRTEDDYVVDWLDMRFDLNEIRSVDFVVEPFSAWQGLAHTLLTFGFADGRHIAISVEVRREKHESFSAIRGLYRQFEVMYVIGDERDVIGLRANIRKDPVYLFPIRATQQQVRSLFVAMLNRANKLASEPEFYNTLTNTCTTNIVRHFEDLMDRNLPFDPRVVLPGYSDELADELELIDFDGDLDGARQRFHINGRSAFTDDDSDWSHRIRKTTP